MTGLPDRALGEMDDDKLPLALEQVIGGWSTRPKSRIALRSWFAFGYIKDK